jgi:hypothetical protein
MPAMLGHQVFHGNEQSIKVTGSANGGRRRMAMVREEREQGVL